MTVAETIRLLGLALPLDQILACLYLERRGLRMCVDFGYSNAIAIANGHAWIGLDSKNRNAIDRSKSFRK